MLVGTPSFFMSCCYAGLCLALVSHGSGLGSDGGCVAKIIVVYEVEVVVGVNLGELFELVLALVVIVEFV